ncbi:MAG: ABC transporter permease [bacterium]
MRLIDQIYLAFKRLRQRILESFIIIFAIGLGTAVICLAIALTLGTRQNESLRQSSFSHMEENYLEITSGEDMNYNNDQMIQRIGESLPEEVEITYGLMNELKENVADIKYAYSDNHYYSVQLEEVAMEKEYHEMSASEQDEYFQKQDELSLSLLTTTVDYFYAIENIFPESIRDEYGLKSGNFFTEDDIENGNRVVVLGSKAAEKAFPDEDPMGKTLEGLYSDSYTVIGVLNEIPPPEEGHIPYQIREINENGIIPLTANRDHGIDDLDDISIHSLKVIPGEESNLNDLYEQLDIYLKNKFNEGYNIRFPYYLNREQEETMRKLKVAGVFAASIGLIIAAINILNLMLAKVLRRTKDIGVFTALGLRKKGVFNIFIWEALLLGIFGAILGFILSFAAGSLFKSIQQGINLIINWQVFLAAVGISTLLSLIFGVYPALQAANIDPVDALRTE